MKKLHILYTEEEGGDFHYISMHTDEETARLYKDVVRLGHLVYQIGDRVIRVSPSYVCLAETVDGYDFVLKKHRIGADIIEQEENDK